MTQQTTERPGIRSGALSEGRPAGQRGSKLSVPPSDDYWLGFCDGVLSTREDSMAEGYLLGRADGSREALVEWVSATFAPTYTPRTAYSASAVPPPPGRVSDRKPQTSAQITAGARWSWRQVEARIAEQARGRATA